MEFGSTKEVGIEVRSQRNLIIPESRNNQQLSHPSVLSCVSTIRMAEIPPSADGMLYQWLRYQKTIGVDHVHMIAEDTFVKAGGFDHSIIKKALKDNFLSIDHTKMDNVKSAHQIRAIVEVGRHGPIKIISGYYRGKVPFKEAYFGHLRKQLSPPPGLCDYHSMK